MTVLLIDSHNKTFLVNDSSKDYHCQYGMVSADDLKNAQPGDKVKTNTGHEFTVAEPGFIDFYKKIKRGAQIIPRKDIGLIITETGINKNSRVIEAGAGSGATGIFLSKLCKKIYSYEIREDFYNLVKKNIEKLDVKNMVLKNKDAKEGFNEKNVDTVILDLPDPWELIEQAKKSLKPGGFLVSYSPTVPQVMDFVEKLQDNGFTHIKTSEITERKWEVKKRKVRPKSQAIGHSGFLTFARKI